MKGSTGLIGVVFVVVVIGGVFPGVTFVKIEVVVAVVDSSLGGSVVFVVGVSVVVVVVGVSVVVVGISVVVVGVSVVVVVGVSVVVVVGGSVVVVGKGGVVGEGTVLGTVEVGGTIVWNNKI